jgi:hypothetical protein
MRRNHRASDVRGRRQCAPRQPPRVRERNHRELFWHMPQDQERLRSRARRQVRRPGAPPCIAPHRCEKDAGRGKAQGSTRRWRRALVVRRFPCPRPPSHWLLPCRRRRSRSAAGCRRSTRRERRPPTDSAPQTPRNTPRPWREARSREETRSRTIANPRGLKPPLPSRQPAGETCAKYDFEYEFTDGTRYRDV